MGEQKTRKKPLEVYIVEYEASDSAKETAEDKLKRLILNEAERITERQAS